MGANNIFFTGNGWDLPGCISNLIWGGFLCKSGIAPKPIRSNGFKHFFPWSFGKYELAFSDTKRDEEVHPMWDHLWDDRGRYSHHSWHGVRWNWDHMSLAMYWKSEAFGSEKLVAKDPSDPRSWVWNFEHMRYLGVFSTDWCMSYLSFWSYWGLGPSKAYDADVGVAK